MPTGHKSSISNWHQTFDHACGQHVDFNWGTATIDTFECVQIIVSLFTLVYCLAIIAQFHSDKAKSFSDSSN